MLVNMKQMLESARAGGYGVGFFNAVNLEMARAVIETAEEISFSYDELMALTFRLVLPGDLYQPSVAGIYASVEDDPEKLNKVLADYEASLEKTRPEEIYKWSITDHVMKSWSLDAPDIKDMIDEALSSTDNLLAGGQYFPRQML